VRTDPDRAASCSWSSPDSPATRCAIGASTTTLAEELRNTERYLVLEQARFADRLVVALHVAPEVTAIAVPFLVVQPLVENAVRHGLEGHAGVVTVAIHAIDDGADALISIEDDGPGSDPDVIRSALVHESASPSVGLGNVDARLRQVYGDRYGLGGGDGAVRWDEGQLPGAEVRARRASFPDRDTRV